MFNLSQDISWSYNFNTGSEQVQMAKGEVCVFRNNNYSTAMNYQAGANFVFKNLQMTPTYFQELLSKYFTDQNITKLKEHFLTHVTKTTITPEMYRVLSEIDTADRFKEYEGVYTEGKMIELTALVLYGIAYHKTDEIKRLPQPNKNDIERIEILQENNLPISQAAQLSGYTNMSHFSKSFVKKFSVLPKDY